MDPLDSQSAEAWTNPSSLGNKIPKVVPPGNQSNQSFTNFDLHQHQRNWVDYFVHDYDDRIDPQFLEFNQPSQSAPTVSRNPSNENRIPDQQDAALNEINDLGRIKDWDMTGMLNNLSFLEQKIRQLQELARIVVRQRWQAASPPDELAAQQQQLIAADVTSIIIQLISTAGSLLPSAKGNPLTDPSSISRFGQLRGFVFTPEPSLNGGGQSLNVNRNKVPKQLNQVDQIKSCKAEQNFNEEHEKKDEEDGDGGENLPLGSYEILQLEKEEILASHTQSCTICGKSFKRDANLRMHMRGHGDEYKTLAALAKPEKDPSPKPMLLKRYSCPYAGCKRNKDHKNFQPLKTILCVKNHFKRTHCDKSYACSRCSIKKFSVIADLRTHEKHCGREKWVCSCGTTFTRKDKLSGHIALFQGQGQCHTAHTPAVPVDETRGSAAAPSDPPGESNESTNNLGLSELNFVSTVPTGVQNVVSVKGNVDDPPTLFSPLNEFCEFPQPSFQDLETPFSFLLSGS